MATQVVNIIVKGQDQVSGVFEGIGNKIGGGGGLGGALSKIAVTAGVAVVGAVGAAGIALGKFTADGIGNAMKLEQQMANIASVMGKTKDEIAPLNDLILDLAINPNLKVDTFEAAQAIELLARNGLTMSQIMDGAALATVQLANATGADFGGAADVATDVMSLFSIEAANMSTAVDGITSVVNNSKFSFDDYRLALAQGGGVAASVGVEFEDFNTAIAGIAPLFASGSDAGTSFKVMLQSLVGKSGPAKEAMAELGLITSDTSAAVQFLTEKGFAPATASLGDISDAFAEYGDTVGLTKDQQGELMNSLIGVQNQFFTAEGELKSMAEISSLLAEATAGLSEEQKNTAFSTIFGTDAMRAAFGLAEQGEVVYTDLQKAADELGVSTDVLSQFMEGGITKFEALQAVMGQTSAAEAAQTRMETLSGQIEILQGNFEALGIKVGQAFLPMLSQLVTAVQGFVDENGEQLVAFLSGLADWLGTNIPVAVQAMTDIWNNTLLPAFQTAWNFIQTNILPAFQTLSDWLSTSLPGATTTLTDLWENTLSPIIQNLGDLLGSYLVGQGQILAALWTNVIVPAFEEISPIIQDLAVWLGENLPGALQTLQTIWETVVLPAVIAFTEYVRDNVIPLIGDLYIWLKTNLPPALQTLADLWQNTLLPGIKAVADFITGTVVPALITAYTWLQTNLPPALQTLANLWQNTLLPGIRAVADFITGTVVPALSELWVWLETTLPPVIQTLADTWNNILLPALTAIWAFIQDPLYPLFAALAELLIVTVEIAIIAIQIAFEHVLLPAMMAVWSFISSTLDPIFRSVAATLNDSVKPALETGTELFNKIKEAISSVAEKISTVVSKFKEFKEKLEELGDKIPDWLKPGSPPPLELGLQGIAEALRKVNQEMGPLGLTMGGLVLPGGGMTGEGGTTNNTYNLTIHSSAPMEPLLADFQMMRAGMAAV